MVFIYTIDRARNSIQLFFTVSEGASLLSSRIDHTLRIQDTGGGADAIKGCYKKKVVLLWCVVDDTVMVTAVVLRVIFLTF